MTATSRFDPARPRVSTAFYKGHGLGNDYLVAEEAGAPSESGGSGKPGDAASPAGEPGAAWLATPAAVRRVCHPHEGIGGDGLVVLLGPPPAVNAPEAPFRLRMFNPDGGEFERSGNGLRVLASHLHRTGRVAAGRPFEVEVGGDRVTMTVHGREEDGAYDVSVTMGRARTGPEAVAADVRGPGDAGGLGDAAEAGIDAHGLVPHPGVGAGVGAGAGAGVGDGAGNVPVWLVSVGNPHCVVFTELLGGQSAFGRDTLDRLGPGLATHDVFRNGINVQLARVVERGDGGTGGGAVEALVWERGVGHTTASGTSACAVAVASVASGRLSPGTVVIRMEGGVLLVDVTPDLDVTLRGPVAEVCDGALAEGFVHLLGR